MPVFSHTYIAKVWVVKTVNIVHFVFKNTAHEHISYSELISYLFYKTMFQENIVKNTCQA